MDNTKAIKDQLQESFNNALSEIDKFKAYAQEITEDIKDVENFLNTEKIFLKIIFECFIQEENGYAVPYSILTERIKNGRVRLFVQTNEHGKYSTPELMSNTPVALRKKLRDCLPAFMNTLTKELRNTVHQ